MDKQAYIRGVLTKYAEQKQAGRFGNVGKVVGRGIGKAVAGLGDDVVRAAPRLVDSAGRALPAKGFGAQIGRAVANAPQLVNTAGRALHQAKSVFSRLINDIPWRQHLMRNARQVSTGAKAMGSEYMRGLGLSTRPFSTGAGNKLLARQSFNPEIMEYIARHMPQQSGARGLRSAFSVPNIGYQTGRYTPLAAALGIGKQIGGVAGADKYAAARSDNDRALTGNILGGLGGSAVGGSAGKLLESGVSTRALGGKFFRGVNDAAVNPVHARLLNKGALITAIITKDKSMLRKLRAGKLGGLALAGAGIYGGIRGGGALQRKLRQPK